MTGIPTTLSHFQQHVRDWESHHFTDLTDGEKRSLQEKLQGLFDHSAFCMQIGLSALCDAVKAGELKSTLELANKSYDYRVMRENAAKKLFGYGDLIPELYEFEKYGYLGSVLPNEYNETALIDYGDITIRFRRKKLLSRVTYTFGDSMSPALSGKLIAGRDGNEVSISGIPYQTIRTLYDTILNIPINLVGTTDYVTKELGIRYIELQYHGKLSISDIESVCFHFMNRDAIPVDLIGDLKTVGCEVFLSSEGSIEEL